MKLSHKSIYLSALLSVLSSFIYAQPLPKIFFVCGGNTGRSPMAEYMANYTFALPSHGYLAVSRGVNIDPKEMTPEENAVLVLDAMNINLTRHRAQELNPIDVKSASLVLTMTQSHKEKVLNQVPYAKNVYMLSECATGIQVDVDDAYEQDLMFYIKTRNQIMAYLQQIANHNWSCVGVD